MDDRVPRLLDKAEAACDDDAFEKAYNYTHIAEAAIANRDLEVEELRLRVGAMDNASAD